MSFLKKPEFGLDTIRKVQADIAPYIHRTPVLTSTYFNSSYNTRIRFKCENLQKAGAFKARGAANAVFRLGQKEAGAGVATHSSGNHAAAVARAAGLRGIDSYIVMPEDAPRIKVEAVKNYGGIIRFCEPGLKNREEALEACLKETGAHFIHPYNQTEVIQGQATAALELLIDYPDLDVIMVPVGGGGLLSGTALAAKQMSDHIRVIGTEPEQADDAFRSFKSGRLIPVEHPDTIADGLRTSLGDLSFPIIQELADDILTVSETQIIRSMRDIWERMKIIIEPSCSLPLAAIAEHPEQFANKDVGIILTGGNVDLDQLPWMDSKVNQF
jgi:threonine dehydratase